MARKTFNMTYLHANIGIAVSLDSGVNIHLLDVDNDKFRVLFCCSQVEPSNNTCMTATKGSTSPFFIPAGLVIFNRTSGSTFPNNTNNATVIITATATVMTTTKILASSPGPIESISSSVSVSPSSSRSSSTKEAAIGAGMGGALGIALLIALIMLWRLRKEKQGLTQNADTWERKYRDSMATKTSGLGGSHQQPQSEVHGLGLDTTDGQHHLAAQLEGWKPDEIDGTEIYEMANKTRRA